MGLGFGWDLGLGFGYLLEINYGEEHREHAEKIMKGKKKRPERHLINLFCFDVIGYKESTRKIKKMIRK